MDIKGKGVERMTEEQSTLTGIEKKYRYFQADGDYPKIIKGDINYCFAFPFDAQMLCEELNEMVETIETLKEENEQLKQQLKDCIGEAKEEIRKQNEENAIRWANIGR